MQSRLILRRAARGFFMVIAFAGLFGTHAGTVRAQDITFGGDARIFAMGGAGIAVTTDASDASSRPNPAALVLNQRPLDFYSVAVALRASGVAAGPAGNYLSAQAGPRQADNLARVSPGRDGDFGLNMNSGVRIGPVEVLASAVGRGRILPSRALRDYVGAGGKLGPEMPRDINLRSDVLVGGIYTVPSVAFGVQMRQPVSGYRVSGGVRVKSMKAVFAHYIADRNHLARQSSPEALLAPEMYDANGEKQDFLTRTGVGVDFGLLAWSKKGFSGALLVNNLVRPDFRFANVTGREGAPAEFSLLKTTITLGGAYQKGGSLVALDLVDVTGAVDRPDLRLGAERRFGNKVAVRAGYSTSGGLTYGFGVLGVGFAFGSNVPLEVSRTLSF